MHKIVITDFINDDLATEREAWPAWQRSRPSTPTTKMSLLAGSKMRPRS